MIRRPPSLPEIDRARPVTFRIGADIGGTFTDLAMIDAAGKRFEIHKILTTPDQPDDAVVAGIGELLARTGIAPCEVDHVIHGTTLFTNALIERKGALTALVTTEGFRDAVEIGREHRYDMYDLAMERPQPLVPRRRRFEIAERVLSDGSVLTPFPEADARALAERLAADGIEAVAISFLHAYANADHEIAMERILAEVAPGIAVSRSSEVSPELREYERTSTVIANVYVKRIAERYLKRLAERLRAELGLSGDLFIMQSNGGLAAVDVAARFPIRLVESGPAGGALAAAHFGAALGEKDLLSFDMGGTTAKAAVIVDGKPLVTPEFEVDRRYLFKKGSGLPVKVPVIEMIEIGTGGGSLAEVDALGRLKVGPESAGAKPGPASYGRGGSRPTVTDADLVLGYLDADFFLGGAMRLDVDAARDAIGRDVAGLFDGDVTRAAFAIHQLANEAMASAARLHAVERGKDVEKFPILAFGGAGPVHAFGIASILRAPRVIYPLGAGVISAAGFLTAPMSFDFVRSLPAPLGRLDWEAAAAAVAEMEAAGRKILADALGDTPVAIRRVVDMRYRKQGYEIRVEVPAGPLAPGMEAPLAAAFETAYAELYGHTVPNTPLEVVSWRVIAEGPKPAVAFGRLEAAPGEAALKGHRPIYLPKEKTFGEVPIYSRYALRPGDRLEGPALVEERESTVVVNAPALITVDAANNLVVDLRHDR